MPCHAQVRRGFRCVRTSAERKRANGQPRLLGFGFGPKRTDDRAKSDGGWLVKEDIFVAARLTGAMR